jgi:hypothetical protein
MGSWDIAESRIVRCISISLSSILHL